MHGDGPKFATDEQGIGSRPNLSPARLSALSRSTTSEWRETMIATLAELDRVRADCRRLVTRRSAMSAGVSVVPLPGIDVLADVGLLASLLPEISEKFGLSHDQVARLEPHVAQRVLAVASGLGNNVIGRLVTKRLVAALLRRVGIRIAAASVAKYVPVIGSAFAAILSFGAMKIAGNAHVDDCYRTARAAIEGGALPVLSAVG